MDAPELTVFEGVSLLPEIAVEKIFTAQYFICHPKMTFAGDCHDSWEFTFCESGVFGLQDDGNEYTLQNGQGFLHRPKVFHATCAKNKICRVVIIQFASDSPALYTLADRVLDITAEQIRYLNIVLREGTPLLAGINGMPPPTDGVTPSPARGQIIKNNLELLFLSFLNTEIRLTQSNSASRFSRASQSITQTIVKIIRDNLSENLSLDRIAEHTGYSVSYITKQFKKHMNCGINEYSVQYKIEKAKELIAADSHSLRQIGEMLGFDTLQYFSTQFKRYTNVTPSAYRKTIQNVEPIKPDFIIRS
jgi:AraC-like DNA-binding protein